jgi:hypothetical protein
MLSLISSMPSPFSGRLALQILAVATTRLTGGLSVAADFPTPPQTFDATYAPPTARMIALRCRPCSSLPCPFISTSPSALSQPSLRSLLLVSTCLSSSGH